MPKPKLDTKESQKATPNSKKPSHSPKSSKSASPATSKKNSDLISYKIRLLDSDQKPLEISISKHDFGQILFNKVCDELGGIIERDYFGLRYMDKNNQRQWLDLGRDVKKQMTGAHSTALSFRVKHYPGNPIADFHQEISQYLLYLQIRRDLVQGRLLCPLNDLYTIGALILQSEYGDAPSDDDSTELNGSLSSEEEYKAYFKNFKIVFNQTKKIESEIISRHKTYRGLTARDAEVEVLKRASKLPTYGVDPFPVKILTKEKLTKKAGEASSVKTAATGDANANSPTGSPHQEDQSSRAPSSPLGSVYLGLRHTGLTTYVGLQPSENFEWSSIERLACDGKDFIVYLKPATESEPDLQKSVISKKNKNGNSKKTKTASTKLNKKPVKPRVVTFRCDTKAAALALWKWTVDRQSFFTLRQASEAKTTKTTHSFFRRSHSYRFIGKSQMELKSLTNSSESLPQPSFIRVSSLRRPRNNEGQLDSFDARATFPGRIRNVEPGSFPMSDPTKRPVILATEEQTAEPCAADSGVMNIASDLRAAPGSEANAPTKGSEMPDPVTVVPVSVTPVASAPPYSTDVDETTTQLRHQPNHTTKPAVRDSECLRAVKEIDQAINSVQSANDHQKPTSASSTLSNGEVVSHEAKTTTGAAAGSVFCFGRTLIYAMKAIAVLGIVCFGAVIVALETHPVVPGSGRQSTFWTDLAVQVQGQPLVASFNEYVYMPLRSLFIGGKFHSAVARRISVANSKVGIVTALIFGSFETTQLAIECSQPATLLAQLFGAATRGRTETDSLIRGEHLFQNPRHNQSDFGTTLTNPSAVIHPHLRIRDARWHDKQSPAFRRQTPYARTGRLSMWWWSRKNDAQCGTARACVLAKSVDNLIVVCIPHKAIELQMAW
ncbi:FERM domain-containing protein 3 [Echinococcus granulosus]|uniref:FERM domain-containing protein 3 n=1 Tax=Echinococcus granulosus TaxID=6210 RepID=W6UVH8_ECHGR|nr:FERM domain-containing protein 3 [Echinococcus granulosus]EUB64646.1 FERM domain-containing protein 3 [Echinococcus granulosus]